MKKICVIGSFNVDIVTKVDRFPQIGESVFADTFDIFTGGKGANQAVALGKLGADVMMAGKLGDRFYGPEYIHQLEKNNVKHHAVVIEKDTYPGIAPVSVDENGDNILIVFPGANGMVDKEYIDSKWDAISECDIFLFQFEIPMETDIYAVQKLKELGKTIILDPAPAKAFPEELLKYIDFITPNETELQSITGMTVNNEGDLKSAAGKLLQKGVGTVIAKAGKSGAYIIRQDEFTHVPGFKVKAIDPTAAGDSFNAGFAYALAEGMDILESARFANAVGGLSTTALGAQSAMPAKAEVEEFLKNQTKG